MKKLYCMTLILAALTIFFPDQSFAALNGGDKIWTFRNISSSLGRMPGKQNPVASSVDSQGNTIITGTQTLPNSKSQCYTIKVSSDGTVVWRGVYGESGFDVSAMAVAVDGSDNVYVTGVIAGANQDVFVLRYDSNSAANASTVWNERFVNAGMDNASSIAVAGSFVYVGGSSRYGGNDCFMVRKYALSNGSLAWGIPNAATNIIGKANSIAVNGSSIAITGLSWSGDDLVFKTIRYDLDGIYKWDNQYADSHVGYNYNDSGQFVRLDSQGHVIASGYVTNGIDNDIYIARYSSADGSILWQKTYDGGYADTPVAMFIDTDAASLDNVYVTGSTYINGRNHIYTANICNNSTPAKCASKIPGELVWGATFNSGTDNYDIPVAIVADAATKNLFVVGYSEINYKTVFRTIKYNKNNGDELWTRTFSGAANNNDRAAGVGLDSSGQAYVAGFADETSPLGNGYFATAIDGTNPKTVLVDANRNWTNNWAGYFVKMTGGSNINEIRQIVSSTATTITLATPLANDISANDTYYIYDNDDYDYYVVKYEKGTLEAPSGFTASVASNTALDLSWHNDNEVAVYFRVERCTNGLDNLSANPCDFDVPTNIKVVEGITGTAIQDTGLTSDKYYYYRVKTYVGPDANFANATQVTYPSNIAHAVTQNVATTDPAGTYIYAGVANSDDYALTMATSPVDGNPVVAGKSIFPSTGFDYYTIKLDRNLNKLWSQRYNDPESQGDAAVCLAVDNNNQIIVSGYAMLSNLTTGTDMNAVYTIKYKIDAPSDVPNYLDNDQDLINEWTHQYNGYTGLGAGDDRAIAIAAVSDASNNIAVVGMGLHSSTDYQKQDIYVLHYPSNGPGTIATPNPGYWAAPPIHKGDDNEPTAVAIDPWGNVIITGFYGNLTNPADPESEIIYDIYTAKFAANTGIMLWEKYYDGGHGDDEANDVAVDPAGNVYVTGFTTNAQDNSDFITLKYDKDGNLQAGWPVVYDGPGHGDDEAVSVKIDPMDGNVVIAGDQLTDAGNHDTHIVRYKAADGSQVWRKTLLREYNNEDMFDMAIDPSGSVYITASTTNNANSDPDTNKDILTFKVDWQGGINDDATLYGTAPLLNKPFSIATNKLGEVFVAGITINDASNADYVVQKIDGDLIQSPYPLTSSANYSSVVLNWNDSSRAEDGYQIARRIGACPAEPVNWADGEIITTGPNHLLAGTTTHTQSGLTQSTTYCYGVRSFKGTGNSRWVNATVTVADPPGPIFNPTMYLDLPNIASDAVYGSSPAIIYGARPSSTTSVRLAWGVPSYLQAPTGYEIWRCMDIDANTPCSDFAKITPAQTPVTQTVNTNFSYTYIYAEDTTVCNGIGYRYKIKAIGSGWTAESVVMGVILPTVDNLVTDGGFESSDPGNPWFSPVGSVLASDPPTFTPHLVFPDNSVFDAWGYSGKGIKLFNDTSATTGNSDWNRTSAPVSAAVGSKTSAYGDGTPLTNQGWKSKKSLTGLSANAVNQATISRDATSTDGSEPQYGFRDVRIYDTVNNVELPTFFVSGMASTSLTVWFKTGANTSGIYAYYGNQSAPKSAGALFSTWYAGRKQPVLLKAGGKYDFSAQVKAGLDHGLLYVNLTGQGYPYSISGGNVVANSDSRLVIDSSNNAGSNVLNHAFNNDGSWHYLSQTVIANSSTNPAGNSYHYVRAYIAPSPCDYIGNTTCSTTSGSASGGTGYPAFNPSGTAYADDVKLVPNYSLTATRASEMQINLSWADSSLDATGYKIERCADAGCATVLTTITVPAGSTAYSDTGLTPDTSYSYRIRPYKTFAHSCAGSPGWNGSGWNGAYSNIATAATTNILPVMTVSSPNTTTANLGWTDTTTTETQFQIERCTGATCVMPPPDSGFHRTAGPGFVSYTDSTACSNTTYNYRLQAVYHILSLDGFAKWTNKVKLDFGTPSSTFRPNLLTRMSINQLTGMDAAFKDIRFYDETAKKELPYWIEGTSGSTAKVWFKTGDNDNVWLYFGNGGATSASSMGSIFGNGLMGYWPFNEAAGTTSGISADLSGMANNVTLNGFSAPYGIVNGGPYGDNALSLNGSGKWLSSSTPNLPTGNVASVEAWIYPKGYSDGAYNGIVVWGSRLCSSFNTLALAIQNNGRPSMAGWCNDFVPGTGTAATLNAWNHIAVVLNGTTVTLYMNGQPVSGTISNINLSSTNLSIGALDYPGRYFNGLISQVRVYNRILTAQEISSRYASGLPAVSVPLQAAVVTDGAGFVLPGAWDGPYSNTMPVVTQIPANLVVDPDFDNGATSWSGTVGTTTGTSFDTTVAYSGAKSLKLHATGATLGLSQTVTVVPGAQYALSGYIKTVNWTAGKAQCDVYGTGIDSGGIYKTSTQASDLSVITSTSNWSMLSETVTIPAGTTSVSIRCFANGSPQGDAWIDMVQLVPVVPVSSLTATHKTEKQIDLAWTFPSNLDQTGFKIDRCSDASCGTVLATQTVFTAAARTYSDTGLDYNTTYWYQVRAYKTEDPSCNGGKGYWETTSSAIQSANTDLTAPSGLSKNYSVSTLCEDVRVVDPSEASPVLNYYIANKDDANSACNKLSTKLIAKIPSIPAGGKTIYLYYGNTQANDASNAGNVFDFYEDFDYADINAIYSQNKWDSSKSDLTGFSVANSKLHGTNTNGKLTSKSPYTYGPGFQVQTRIKATSFPSSSGFTPIGFSNSWTDNAGLNRQLGTEIYSNNDSFTWMITTPPGGTAQTDTMQFGVTLKNSSKFNPWIYDWEGNNNLSYWDPGDISQTVNTRPIVIGRSYSDDLSNKTYAADWEWIRVRKYADPAPSSTLGAVDTSGIPAPPYTLAGEPGTWRFRKPVTINYPSGPTLSGYQLNITTDTTALAIDRNTLTWTDNTSSETNFILERCDGADCNTSSFPRMDKSFTIAPQSDFGSSVSYTDREMAVNTKYCYRVKAINAAWTSATPVTGETPYSSIECQTTNNPAPPSDLQASPQTSVINLTWNDNTTGETGFTLECCKGATCVFQAGIDFDEHGVDNYRVIPVPPNASATGSFTDSSATGLPCSGTFYYRISAFKDKPDGTPWNPGPSNVAGPAPLSVDPDTPVGVTATRNSEQQITVGWTDSYTGESGYEVYRCVGTGCTPCPAGFCPAYALLATPATNINNYVDTNFITPGTTYGYQIRVKVPTACGDRFSAPSAIQYASATVNAPSAFTTTIFNSNTTQSYLSWTDNTAAESGFTIMRCSGPPPCATSYSDVTTVAPGAGTGTSINYYDTSICADKTYTYIVAPREHASMPLSNPGSQPVWKFRSPLNFTGFMPDTVTQISIPYDADMQTDFRDIRFYDRDAGKELPYWLQTYNATTAKVWFKTGATSGIDLYYGNAGATSSSNSANLFAGNGLAAYWPFEEANNTYSGSTTDISGNGKNGNLNNFTSGYGIVAGGKYGNALSSDGVNDYVSVTDTSGSVLDITDEITIELWYQYQKSPDWGRLVSKATTDGGQPWEMYGIWFDNTSDAIAANPQQRVYFGFGAVDSPPTGTGAYNQSAAGPRLTPGQWYHVVGRYKSSTGDMSLFVNGVEYGPINIASKPKLITNNAPLYIGGRGQGTVNWNPGKGIFDELRIYNRALTNPEVASRYAATLPVVTIGPKSSTSFAVKVPLGFSAFQPNTLAKITITRNPANNTGSYNPRPDFRDIRFYDRDANKDIPYWIRKINLDGSNNPISAEVWFLTGATSGIDLYYGNSASNNASPDMVGWWPFDEANNTISGNTADMSGWGMNGSLSNNFSSPYGIVSGGKYGNGLNLNGDNSSGISGNYVSVTDSTNSSIDIGDNLSIELWYKYDKDSAAYSNLVSKTTGNGSILYALYLDNVVGDNTRGVKFKVGNGSSVQIINLTTPVLVHDNWYHIVARYDKTVSPAEMAIFVNGQKLRSVTFTTPLTVATSDRPLYIGASEWSSSPSVVAGNFAKGIIDDVRIYNHPLTDAEILARSDEGASLQVAAIVNNGPVAYWPFEEAAQIYGLTADQSGNLPQSYGIMANNFTSGYGIVSGGKFGNALKLNGTSNYVEVPVSSGSVLDINGSMTIDLWYYYDSSLADSDNSCKSIVERNYDAAGINRKFNLYLACTGGAITNTARTVNFAVTDASASYNVFRADTGGPSPNLVNNAWNHIVGRYDASVPKISVIINGVELNSNTTLPIGFTALGASSEPIKIGANYNLGSFLKGKIDEVTIYNRALDPTEITAHHDSTTPMDMKTVRTSVTTTLVTTDPANILVDSDFENGASWWYAVETTNYTYINTAIVYSGIKSLYLDSTTNFSNKGRSQTVNVTPNAWYTLSGYLKTNMTSGMAQCDVYGTNIDSGGIASTGVRNWTEKKTETVQIPAGTTSVNIRCFVDGAPHGQAWIDQVQFVPTEPIALSATRASESSILLNWNDIFFEKTGFNVYRCMDSTGNTPCTNFVNITQAGPLNIDFRDTGLVPGQTYRYKVTAYKNATCPWESSASNIASVQTSQVAPVLQSVTPLSSTSMQLTWTDSTSADSGYNIYRCMGGGCEPCTDPADCSTTSATYSIPANNINRSLDQWRKVFYPFNYTTADKSNNQLTGVTNLSNQITGIINATGLSLGMAVNGTNIPADTFITNIFSDIATWTKYDNTVSYPLNSYEKSSNGRIPLGRTPAGDDGGVLAPSVIIDDNGVYKMWYSGYDGTYWRIYLATSLDGMIWIKYDNWRPDDSNDVSTDGRIPLGKSGTGDSNGVLYPSVIKDGLVYKMWYTGYDAADYRRIFYATSLDGLNWTKRDNSIPANLDSPPTPGATTPGYQSSNGRIPVGTDVNNSNIGDSKYAVYPMVIKDNNEPNANYRYKMWYSGGNPSIWRIYHATSPDGIAWTKYDNSVPPTSGTVLEPMDANITPTNGHGRLPLGSNNSAIGDRVQIRSGAVIKDGTLYRMWYSGSDGTYWRVFYATSLDGLNWTKQDNTITALPSNTTGTNGRIPLGDGDSAANIGDKSGTVHPCVIKDGPNYKMWYTGSDNSYWRLYYATNQSTVTLSKNPTAAGSGNFVFGPTSNSRIGSVDPTSPAPNQITGLASTAGLTVGMSVAGPNIPAGTKITVINNATSVTLSNIPSAAATGNYVFSLDLSSSPWDPTYDVNGGIFLNGWYNPIISPVTSILDNDSHTIEFDLNFKASYNDARKIISYSPPGGPTLVVSTRVLSDSPLLTWTYNDSGVDLAADGQGAKLLYGRWYHFRGEKIGSTLNIYMDDKLAATATVPTITDHTPGTRLAALQLQGDKNVATSIKNLGIYSGYSAKPESSSATYTDMQVCPDTYYNYRVMPVNNSVPWNGLTSNRAGNTALTFIPPAGLTASAISENNVLLSWLPGSSNDQHSFIVKKCEGATCAKQNNITATTYNWGGLASDGTEFCFSVAGWKNATWCSVDGVDGATSQFIPRVVNETLSSGNSGAWTNRAPVNVTDPQANVQTRLVVSYLTGMNNDFSDIRLFDTTTQQEIPFWLESKSDGNSAVIWFKIPDNTSDPIYLYYGNPSAGAPNYSGSSVFDFFDDFNYADATDPSFTANWTTSSAVTPTTCSAALTANCNYIVSGGKLTLKDTGIRLTSNATFGVGKTIEAKIDVDTFTTGTGGFISVGLYGSSPLSAGILHKNPAENSDNPIVFDCYHSNGTGAANGPASFPAGFSVNDAFIDTVNIKGIDTWNYKTYDSTLGTDIFTMSDISATFIGANTLPIGLGSRYNGPGSTAYSANWDWVRVRKYAATPPTATLGTGAARDDYNTCVKTMLNHPTNLGVDLDGNGIPDVGSLSPYPYKIPLAWNDNSGTESNYIVERKVWNGQWIQRAVTGSSPDFIDTVGIEPQKTYYYRIKALSLEDNVLSPASNEFIVTTPAFNAPAAPDHTTCVCTESGTVCQ